MWFWFFVLNRRATEWFVFVWCWRQWQLHFAWQAQLVDRSSLLSSSRVSFYFVPFIFFVVVSLSSSSSSCFSCYFPTAYRDARRHTNRSLSQRNIVAVIKEELGPRFVKKKNGDDQFEMKENVHQTRFPPYFDLDSKKIK